MTHQDQIRTTASAEYRRSPTLQDEFPSEGAYVAFRCAVHRGAARIAPSTLQHHEKNGRSATHPAHPAHDVRADASAVSGYRVMAIQPGRAVSREDRETIKGLVREFQQTRRPGSYRLDELGGFVALRAGLSAAQAVYAIEQSCRWSQPVGE